VAFEEKYKKRMALGQDGNQLVNLLVVLAIAFVLLQFVFVIYKVNSLTALDFRINVLNHFTVPPRIDEFLGQPWTILTYMFVHFGLMRVIGNLLWLWAFGFIMQDLMGNRKIIPLFLYGAVCGAFFFLLTFNLFFRQNLQIEPLEGASAGLFSVAVATTLMSPRYRIFPMLNGGVPLWIITLIFIVVDFASISIFNVPALTAQLMGGITGFAFIYLLRKGIDITNGLNYLFDRLGNLFNPSRKPAQRQKEKHFYKVGGTHPFKRVPNITQQRIDSLLDKIHQQGYWSLSEEEREILKRASEEDNL